MESVPASVTFGGGESHMLEVLTVVQQSLERWKTHQRHTRHLIMDTRVLEEERVHVGKMQRDECTSNCYMTSIDLLLIRTGQREQRRGKGINIEGLKVKSSWV